MRHLLAIGSLAVTLGASWLPAQDTVIVGVGGELSSPVREKLRVPVFADLRLAGNERLGSYTIRLSWNPNVLSFNGWRSGSFAEPVVRTDSAFSYGVLWASAVSPAGQGGIFNLIDVELVPDSTEVDTLRISVTELSAAGTLTDLLAAAVVRTVDGVFCPALGRWGDLDRDGRSNSRDALAVLSYVVGLPVDTLFNLALGDVDGDSKLNTRDALIILSYAVGLDIPGQRVLLVAGGVCASGVVPELAVVPDTADLVVGQGIDLKVFGRAPTGRLTALNGLQWEVADPRIAAVDSAGMVIAREPGTTVATAAVGPGVRVRAVIVSKARRGTWFVDAARAKRSPVQMGTLKWPFATPQFAFPHVREGDTIRVAPGVHDYEEFKCFGECPFWDQLGAGVIVIGDTLADGTRPVLRAPEQDFFTAFTWHNGVRAEVRNLVLRGFYVGMQLGGLRTLLVDNLRIEEPPIPGYGIIVWGIDTLSVSRSEILGDSSGGGYFGIRVLELANLVRISDSRIVNWLYGIIGEDVFRFELERSEVSFNRSFGVWLGTEELDAPPSARFSHNRLVGNGAAIAIDGAGTVATDHNYILATEDDAITIYSGSASSTGSSLVRARAAEAAGLLSGTKLTMLADSIRFRANNNFWLNADGLDSVLIDSIWVENPADTLIVQYNWLKANVASVTNSRFVNLAGEGIAFRGRKLVVDNSSFTGCSVCDWNRGRAIQAYAWDEDGPQVVVSNSTFGLLYEAVLAAANSYGDTTGPMIVVKNTVDSVSRGVTLNGDSLVVRENVFTRIRDHAVSAAPSLASKPFVEALIGRNRVSCSVQDSYPSIGLRHNVGPARFEENVVTGCDYGLFAENSSGVHPIADVFFTRDSVVPADTSSYHVGLRVDGRVRPRIIGSRVVGGYIGIDLVLSDTGGAVIDSNAISGTGYAGIRLYSVQGAVTGRRNNIANNRLDGILNQGTSGPRSFTLGKFQSGGVGNGRYAVNSASAFDASQNWWGSPNGAGGRFGSGLADADSVSSAQVDVSNPLTSEPSEPPPLSSPPLAALRYPSPLWTEPVGTIRSGSESGSPPPRLPDSRLEVSGPPLDPLKERALERVQAEREEHRARLRQAQEFPVLPRAVPKSRH